MRIVSVALISLFIDFISSIQESALLAPNEISHLKLDSPLEKALIEKLTKSSDQKINLGAYNAWLDDLRQLKNIHFEIYNENSIN